MYALAIAAYAILTAAATLGYVSVGNTHWSDAGSSRAGLFQTCVDGRCHYSDPGDTPDWLMATQALFIIGVVCLGLNQIVMGFHIFGRPWSRCPLGKSTMETMSLALATVAGVCELVAISIYGAERPDNLGWGFGLGAGAGALALLGAVLLFIVKKNRPQDP